jgi:two-component system sensor histidine kinase/response regulator
MMQTTTTTTTTTPLLSTLLRKREPVNILIVDDRPENLISLESFLIHEDRNIIKANSGNEALKIALENDIALMLLDVQMPHMDGFEVARLLKDNSRTKDISILFVTALSTDEKYTMQGYEEGAVDYLHKPLDINLVKAKVNVFEKLYRQRIELKESNERLKRMNQQLDEFVYIVSHDLKAPLRGMSSLCTFIEEELADKKTDSLKELLDMMRSRSGRMQALIDGILHYSRMANSTTTKEKFSVKELIVSIIDLLNPPSHIKFDIADSLPTLTAEKIKLHEVFQNLISNAIKYNDKTEGHINISFLEYPEHFEFSVRDNGCGIRQEHFHIVFGIFQTLVSKDKNESTGIGLTIVKKIVENQGGSVSIESEFEKGTTFKFIWKK